MERRENNAFQEILGMEDVLRGFRLMRLLRFTRLCRMARLLRSIPELLIIVRAIGIALRSAPSVLRTLASNGFQWHTSQICIDYIL